MWYLITAFVFFYLGALFIAIFAAGKDNRIQKPKKNTQYLDEQPETSGFPVGG